VHVSKFQSSGVMLGVWGSGSQTLFGHSTCNLLSNVVAHMSALARCSVSNFRFHSPNYTMTWFLTI
jgi:hypothetical protein